ncbi:Ig-like domain-containing protein [Candidatus Peregrinibacteria bacterium]|nr:Ig-like domain-containing protein [Candidatus Peregrinibacteria bacterium]
MKRTVKKILKFLGSPKGRIGSLIFTALMFFGFIYAFIPAPSIDDGYLPDEIRKVSFNAPLTVHFSQPMNRSSVEKAFSVEPSFSGTFHWKDSRTLEYQPAAPLAIGDDYRVTVSARAKSAYLKKLGMAIEFRFMVTGPPFVKFISPYLPIVEPIESPIVDPIVEPIEEPAEEIVSPLSKPLIIPPNQVITVMFDRPMRALTTVDESASSQGFPELLISPPVKGTYRWVGTTAFQFISDAWPMGTTYTLTLPKGISALDGGQTEQDVIWQLSTDAPRVISSDPPEGSEVFPVGGDITLYFNQEMDLDFIRPGDNVLLYPSNDLDADQNLREDGFFNTEVVYGEDENGKTDKTRLVFKPEFSYRFNQDYKLVVTAGLLGATSKAGGTYGGRPMAEDFTLLFKTSDRPGITAFQPARGEQNYEKDYVMIDFSSPMTKELVLEYASLSPAPADKPSVYLSDQGRHAEIVYNFKPSAYYDFELKAPFKDENGQESDKGFKTSFKTAPRKPALDLLTRDPFGFFMDGLGPVYPVKTVNISQANVKVCEVGEQEFFRVSQNYDWYKYHCLNPLRATIDIESDLNESHFFNLDLTEVFDRTFGQGIYFFDISSRQYTDSKGEPIRFYQTFFISDTTLTLKKSETDLLVWATDLKTGQPVSRMELKILSSEGQELQRGVTDGNGLYKITRDFQDNVYVVGRKTLEGEDRWSMAGQYWSDGIQPWQYQVSGQWVGYGESRLYLYTERPLYKPGDELFFKGLYRVDQDASLSLPKDRKVRIVLEDPEYNEIQSEEVFILPDGSFNGSIALSDKARLGRYNLYAETVGHEFDQRFYHNFFVEEYKKPKFQVELFSNKTDYYLGETIPADIQASYYFGGAIQEGEVHWTLMREPYFFDRYKGEEYYSFGTWSHFRCFWFYCESETEIVAEGDEVLDRQGKLSLQLPTDQEGVSGSSSGGQSYLYTLNAEVRNKDGEFVANRETFIVHQGSYYIGLNSKSYIVQPEETLELKVITVSPEAEPVSGKRITLELYREEWNTVKKQGVDGAFYDESVRELKPVDKKGIITSDEPIKVLFEIGQDMPAGSYTVQAKGSEGSHQILSEINFYVSSSSWVNWGSDNNSRMELVADQPEYFVGGKARVLIKSPYGSEDKPAKALVTYERGGIQHYEVIDIRSNADTIEIPITDKMVPNVYVTVMVMKDISKTLRQFLDNQDQFRLQNQKAALSVKIRALDDEIAALKTSEDEAEMNRNKILTGKKETERAALQAEWDEADQALKAMQKGEAEPIDFELVKPDFKLGIVNLNVSRREQQILIDLKPGQPSYQVGEEVAIEIHTYDYQNRPVPSVVSLAVVDASLLALKANTKENPLDYFYGARDLQVSTATNLTLHVDRIDVTAAKGAKGGGGGGAEETFDKQRGEFKDTAYFNPLIETDDGGYAKVTFEPPDNLTTWEMWAVASSGTDRFGMAKEDFVVKKPLAITSVLPRFAISGDVLTVGALVHNQSGQEAETKVELIADGLTIKGPSKKSAVVADGATERIDWPVTVQSVSKEAVLTIRFASREDTVEYRLPVYPFSVAEVVALNGTTDSLHTEKVLIPDTVEPSMGGLDVRLGGSLATRFIKAFETLRDYPYGCAEQLTSQLLPLLVVTAKNADTDADLFALMGLDAEESAAAIEETLQKLSKFQRFDGGYGFWEGSIRSYPFLTSYILYSQYLARDAGFTVSDNNFNQAAQYLWKQLNISSGPYVLRLDERAFVLWVLSEIGQGDTGMTLSLFDERESLRLYSRALMLMTLENLYNAGQRSVGAYTERLKSELASHQLVQDRTIHFEEDSNYWWDLNTDRRTTAMVLMALNRENPDNPILPNMVNYLAHASKQSFLNTQETAWMLMAMLEYADSQDVLTADFEFSADLNGHTLLKGAINADNLSEVLHAFVPLDDLHAGDDLNTVEFEKDGDGQLVFDMEFKYYLPNEIVPPQERGLHIARQYYQFDEGDGPAKVMTSGKLYRGELNLIVPEDMHYVVVEERLPAGLEAINFNLDTADTSLQHQLEAYNEAGENYWIDNPLWHFNHRETRDDRVLLFADYLPKGVYTYSFLVRAGLPGTYHHLPATAYQMYFPEVFGRTGGEWLEVEE